MYRPNRQPCSSSSACRRQGFSAQCLQHFAKYFLMMSWHDDMMIANGLRQEVFRFVDIFQLNDLLRAAEVGLCLVPDELTLGNEAAAEVT